MRGYAVVDLETTGLHPEGHDRIAEIAIVLVDEHGRIQSEWDTLINPHRDLGPVHLHGIRGADGASAPDFADVIGTVIDQLAGRVVVAHNASFEARFLRAEFARAGVPFPLANDDFVCTMKLAKTMLPGAGRSLADCCAAFDIDLHDAHQALVDTRATALLLGAYIGLSRENRYWQHHLDHAGAFDWPHMPFAMALGVSRSQTDAATRGFLERATHQLAPIDDQPTDEQLEYLALVDEALRDGILSVAEADALHALAERLGFAAPERRAMHLDYFASLTAAVWADAALSAVEEEQVRAVARMLDIPEARVVEALAPPAERGDTATVVAAVLAAAAAAAPTDAAPTLATGALIVLTGEMRYPRAELELELVRLGYVVHGAVTKKVALVIAADVTSLSGKARKARDYGIPIVGEEWLEQRVGLAIA